MKKRRKKIDKKPATSCPRETEKKLLLNFNSLQHFARVFNGKASK